MPVSSSAFIPTINAITSSQDLQWMVQPTVITTTPSPRPRAHPYENPPLLSHARPGVIRSVGDAHGRCRRDEQLTPEEEEKRRLRRERNKMAAAKCRSRRKELTDWLQGETEKLEEEKVGLQKEIETLQMEREKLELVLISHKPICQLSKGEEPQEGMPLALLAGHNPRSVVVKQEPAEDLYDQDVELSSHKRSHLSVIKPTSSKGAVISACSPNRNGLHTSTVASSTPSHTPTDADNTFAYTSLSEQDSPWPGPKAGSSPSMHQASDSLCTPSLLHL